MFYEVLEKFGIVSKKPTANEAIENALKSIFEVEKQEVSPQEGFKLDQDKLSYTILPFTALTEVVKVLEFGKQKYAKDNWQKVANGKERYLDAAFRHLVAYIEGETIDKESGLHHLAHATCCLLFILWFDLTNKK